MMRIQTPPEPQGAFLEVCADCVLLLEVANLSEKKKKKTTNCCAKQGVERRGEEEKVFRYLVGQINGNTHNCCSSSSRSKIYMETESHREESTHLAIERA